MAEILINQILPYLNISKECEKSAHLLNMYLLYGNALLDNIFFKSEFNLKINNLKWLKQLYIQVKNSLKLKELLEMLFKNNNKEYNELLTIMAKDLIYCKIATNINKTCIYPFYIPKENSSIDKTTNIVNTLCKKLGCGKKYYRKIYVNMISTKNELNLKLKMNILNSIKNTNDINKLTQCSLLLN